MTNKTEVLIGNAMRYKAWLEAGRLLYSGKLRFTVPIQENIERLDSMLTKALNDFTHKDAVGKFEKAALALEDEGTALSKQEPSEELKALIKEHEQKAKALEEEFSQEMEWRKEYLNTTIDFEPMRIAASILPEDVETKLDDPNTRMVAAHFVEALVKLKIV